MAAALERDLWRRLERVLTLRLLPAFDVDLRARLAPAYAARLVRSLTGPNARLLDT